MIIRAYAKVNITLRIKGLLPGGYHEIESFMQTLPDLYDVLEIVESDETKISCSDESLSCGSDNLAAKALKAMGKTARVHIEKHIPIAAGLAGGSADAAAVIYAFLGASDEAYKIAASLGSDIPFSLYGIQHQGRAAALATGRGTELSPKDPMPGIIITKTPAVSVPTPLVYKEYDKMKEEGYGFPEENHLQAPAIRLFPEIQQTLDELRKPHPVYGMPAIVQQSGSGPTCFAMYRAE